MISNPITAKKDGTWAHTVLNRQILDFVSMHA